MKHIKILLLAIMTMGIFASCIDEEEYDNNPRGNFQALWHIIDEHYCFFDYKQKEYGLDWKEIYKKYDRQINPDMTDLQLFEVMANMLGELKDGHVNMGSTFDLARYWKWYENYPANFSDSIITKYLGTNYRVSSGMKYKILDDNIGYIRIPSFANEIGNGNIDDALGYMAPCNGLIIDIRGNGGGLISNAEKLAMRFTNKELLVGYLQHKTGKGHNDFSPLKEIHLKPSKRIRWQKKVVILTNRKVFSAANEFVQYMKCCPKVTVVGDQTGGGAGMPFSNELPNGWSVRFSACPLYDNKKQSTEFGIKPDHKIDITDADYRRSIDTIIEFARKLLH